MFGIVNAQPKNFLTHYIFQKSFMEYAGKYIRGRLIDIGCAGKPYRELLAPLVSEHIGLDREDCRHGKDKIDLFGTALEIPSSPDSFDSAICTAVLEHLEEPEAAVRECFRVLKPGGQALYSVPFIWHLHEEPRDFYRFTRYGLEHIFKKAGFELVEMKALSGYWVTAGQLAAYYLHRFNVGPLRWLKIIDLLGLVIQGLAYGLDSLDRAEEWTWMYLCVVKKPESAHD